MSESRSERVWELFDLAVELPKHQRSTFLDQQCASDAQLRAQVQRLLAGDEKANQSEAADGFLKSPVERQSLSRPGSASGMLKVDTQASAPLPRHIGKYQILSLLGEGGMGTVYKAEQVNPKRIVALKVVRRGLVSRAMVRRVSHEAQILGRLQHACIAQIYEAGLAEDDLPYFAMEFIPGLPLDDYVRKQASSAKERLRLMAEICEAMHYAHEQGVIHRDLKPTNILVDATGQPKILDFGIARAVNADGQTSGAVTGSGQLIGTLNYMSPEQIQGIGEGLDRRTDVYSLGVVLYEILTGHMPYDIRDLPLPEMARVICEHEAKPLSASHPQLRGDVETIVSKALQKDRTARYTTAGALAEDIRRYLNNQPILARPPSTFYVLMKFARRHTAAVLGAVGFVLALLIGLAGTLLFALRAEHNARLANQGMTAAIFQTYRARMAATAAALANHDVGGAERQLSAAPAQHRDWEWDHFRSRLDDSTAALPVPAGATVDLLNTGSHLQLAITHNEETEFRDELGQVQNVWPIKPGHRATRVGQAALGVWRLEQTPQRELLLCWQDAVGKTAIELPDKTTPTTVAVSQDSKWLAIAWDGPEVRSAFDLFSLESGAKIARCHEHTDVIRSLAFSPDGRSIASASEDSTIRIWAVPSGAALQVLKGHRVKVHHVDWRADGQRLVSTSADGSVRQWDTAGHPTEPAYDRHTGEVLVARYSPDGQMIASAGTDRSIRLWSADGRKDVALLHGHVREVNGLCFAADGRRLLSSGNDDRARLWETEADDALPTLVGHASYVYPVAISPDGEWIASGSWDRTVRLWDAWTGEHVATFDHPQRVLSLAFSADSTWLVTGCGDDDRLRIWQLGSHQPCRELPGPGRTINYVGVNADDSQLIAVDMSGRCLLTDIDSGKSKYQDAMSTVAFSPDRSRIATNAGHESKEIVIRDAVTLKPYRTLTGHKTSPHSIAFSHDNQHLVSIGHDQSMIVWDVESGVDHPLPGTTDQVFAAVYHPNGHRIATAGRDGSITLWDTSAFEEVGRLTGHSNYIWSLAFSPDGQTLFSASGDSTVRLWETRPISLRHIARRQSIDQRASTQGLLAKLRTNGWTEPQLLKEVRKSSDLSATERHALLRELLSGN